MTDCLDRGRELKLTSIVDKDGKDNRSATMIQDQSEEEDRPVNESNLCSQCRINRRKHPEVEK
jgi:hypothetical protein